MDHPKSNFERLRAMSDAEVQSVWDAIQELGPWDRPDDEWMEDVYAEISDRGLRAGPNPNRKVWSMDIEPTTTDLLQALDTAQHYAKRNQHSEAAYWAERAAQIATALSKK